MSILLVLFSDVVPNLGVSLGYFVKFLFVNSGVSGVGSEPSLWTFLLLSQQTIINKFNEVNME